MTLKKNLFITHQTSVTISVAFCSAATNAMAAAAYPVFSSPTTDGGTNVYGIDYPLLKLSPTTASVAVSVMPSTTNTTAGTFSAYFTNAVAYNQTVAESEGNAKRYKYLVYQSGYETNLPAAYSFGLTANTNIYLAGTIDFVFGTATVLPLGDRSTNVCTVTVAGVPVNGGFS